VGPLPKIFKKNVHYGALSEVLVWHFGFFEKKIGFERAKFVKILNFYRQNVGLMAKIVNLGFQTSKF